ncbi:MAG: TatD family hydrolase [Finegoldia sp.]|nr:TatD family hydrolase [Finegoldia sp.]
MADYTIYDTHCHLQDEDFDDDREQIIKDLRINKVAKVMLPSSNLDDSYKAVKLAEENEELFCAVGIHPEDCESFDDSSIDKLLDLSKSKKCLAIGEIGLDYHYDGYDEDLQKKIFKLQLGLAEREDLPVIIHSRDALEDTYEILLDFPKVRGVMHSYSGTVEMAQAFIDLAFFLSFNGIVTFKNAKNLKEVCKKVDINKILLETDAPYLAPHPNRGKRNEPKYVNLVLEEVASLKDMPVAEVAEVVNRNADKVFGW